MIIQTDLSVNVKKLLNISADDVDALLNYYNISHKTLEDMVYTIKAWYEKQQHLPQGYLHDRVIIGHLISRAFSVERVKENIENCLIAKNKLPDIICHRDPLSTQLSKYLRQGYWVTLPKKTPDNYRVTIFKLDKDCDAYVVDIMKIAFMLLEYRCWNDVYLGDIWIMDYSNINMAHALQMTPVVISKLMFYTTCCFGAKIRGIHLINLPSYASTALMIFKKAMKGKLVQRIHVHNKIEDALKKFPIEMVPKDFGGEEMSIQEITDEWTSTFQSKPWRQYLIEQDSVRTNESKRVTKSVADGFFGIDGSFRQLDLD